ncbi:MAG: glycosyltransferase, partial [Muribaculaceae bacterium]|nr:glycosyltransferase [Muribaculaceae bacterium]
MVSILVPVYNVENYIEKCARSLFGQTYRDVEYIFVDDASPDRSIEVLSRVMKDYDGIESRVRIIRHDANRGLAAARNTAVDAAEGEYIVHVDSDDWLAPDFVEVLMQAAGKEDADLVVSGFMEVRANSSVEWKNETCVDNVALTKSLLRRKSLTHIIGKLIRRSVLTDNNLRAVEGINQGEDYLMTPRIAYYSKKIAVVDRPLYFYNRTNITSYTANVNKKGIEQIIDVQSRLVEFFSGIPDAHEYVQTLKKSCIFNKLSCFYSAPFSVFPEIAALYPEIDWRGMDLKGRQKLVLWLSDHR